MKPPFIRFLTAPGMRQPGAVMPMKSFPLYVAFNNLPECLRNLNAYVRWAKKSRRLFTLAKKMNKLTTEILTLDCDNWIRAVIDPDAPDSEQSAPQRSEPSTPPATDK